MGVIEKIKNIADAIREKSGKTSLLTLDEMPIEIKNLSIGSGSVAELVPGAAPNYVNTEAYRVASNVRALLDGEFKHDVCTVGICISDSHYYPDENTRKGVWSAVNAIKALTYLLPVDFIAHLGDVAHEDSQTQTTNALQVERMNKVLGYLKECSGGKIPLFVAVGNHDTSTYITTSNTSDVMSAEYLYNNFTSLAKIDSNTVLSGAECGGYCYRDFEDKRLRVYLLNTGDKPIRYQDSSLDCTSDVQKAWVASTLIDGLNSKLDANEWSFIVLCHYPLDYGSNIDLSNVFEAYVNGKSITLDGKTYDFNGHNSAKFMVQFHGHVHNFLVDRLHYGTPADRVNGTSPAYYDVYRMGIPNAQYDRENYYYPTDSAGRPDPNSIDGTLWGIKFFEGDWGDAGASAKKLKTPNSAQDVSFVVNVINPAKNKIYSYCYGAGVNRTVDTTGVTYHTVIRNLTGATSSGTMASVEDGMPLTETITLAEGMILKSISVTMGHADISSSVSIVDNNYVINIPEVTGNVTITVRAELRENFTNLVRFAEPYANTAFSDVNAPGYYANRRLNSSLNLTADSATGLVTTGYVPIEVASDVTVKTIRIAGDGIAFKAGPFSADGTNYTYCRFALFDKNFNKLEAYAANVGGKESVDIFRKGATITTEGVGNDAKITSITVDANRYPACFNAAYMVISVFGTDGSNLIVTVNEELSYGGPAPEPPDFYAVSYNMPNHVTSSNTAKTAAREGAFSATLTSNAAYDIESVTVRMGGINVTSTAYNPKTRAINISRVTGAISIAVTTALSPNAVPAFTNRVHTSIDVDGSVYNGGLGYINNYRINSSHVFEATPSYDTVTTGFMAVTPNTEYTVRVAGEGISGESMNWGRFVFYDSEFNPIVANDGSVVKPWGWKNLSGAAGMAVVDEAATVLTVVISTSSVNSRASYLRISALGKGENLIVTLDEPIAYTI